MDTMDYGINPNVTYLATLGEVGSVWGVAATTDNNFYIASALKRHSGYGPGGAGQIYHIDDSGNLTSFVNLKSDLGIDVDNPSNSTPTNSSRGLGVGSNDISLDSYGYNNALKTGLGDIDVSDDGDSLFVMNLYDKTIYLLNGNNGSQINSYAIPSNSNCSGNELRPFALSYHNDVLYTAVTCTAEDGSGSLWAYVYEYSFSSSSWNEILDIDLSYLRSCAEWQGISNNNTTNVYCKWNPWVQTNVEAPGVNSAAFAYPQPMLSDIEFNDCGDMYIGFIDRSGLQYGALNASMTSTSSLVNVVSGGELLVAGLNGGNYALESSGAYTSCDGSTYETVGFNNRYSNPTTRLGPG